MSRPQPRAVYVRRRLLLLAGVFLLAWAVVQFWPFGSSDDPVTTTTVAAPASTSPTSVMPSATPIDTTATVKLDGGGKTCDPETVTLSPSVPSPQHARASVAIDVTVTTSSKKPCVLKPKTYDPIAVVKRDSKDVWDSSDCEDSLLGKRIQLTPGWATTVRAMWEPRKSGKKCDDHEDWLSPDSYTLRIGMLGGEPGKSTFTLSKPKPKPKPTDEPEQKNDQKSGDKSDQKSSDKSDEKSDDKKSGSSDDSSGEKDDR